MLTTQRRTLPALYLAAILLVLMLLAPTLYSQQSLLLRNPSLSHDKIAFLYAGDIWTVARSGGVAMRLTSDGKVGDGPYFSPNGREIAYTAWINGQNDVYIIPVDGGIPRRITWNPEGSYISGWSPDGKDVLIAGMEESQRHFLRLFRVHADGSGIPQVLPLPQADSGAYSPDGGSMAYVPNIKWEKGWKRYVGGQTTPIWIVNMKTLDVVKVPRENSNDSNPVWVGDTVYFLSDREPTGKNAGPVSLWQYDTKSRQVSKVLENTSGFDLKSFQAGPANDPPMLVVEQFGSLHLVDPVNHTDLPVSIQLDGAMARLTPHTIKVAADEIKNAQISPTGARAVFEAHGEIFTVPAEKGDTRNLTNTPGAAERDPSWSPDGKTIAYFSDASGEYQLYLEDQTGLKPPVAIDLGPNPTFFYAPTWSPDSKHIAYADAAGHLLYLDVPAGKPQIVATSAYQSFGNGFNATWSPDSKWLAYNNDLPKGLNAVFLYSIESHASTQITDGMSDANNPVFDANGKYLYFLASTDDGPSRAGIDLSGMDRATTSAPYVIVLSKDGASPLPPESDDEKVKADDKKDAGKDAKNDEAKDSGKSGDKKDDGNAKKDETDKPVEVKIDLDHIGDRILALPIPPRNYLGLAAGKTGVLFLAEGGPFGRPSNEGDASSIHAIWKFTLDKRKADSVLTDLTSFAVSADGSKVLYGAKGSYSIAAVDDLKSGDGGKPLNLGDMEMTLDLRAEWKQIYHETWRIERDFFYDPNHHGLDIDKIEAKYRPFLAGVASRSELTYLSSEMLSEMTVGHMFMGGPKKPDTATKTGLLGARYSTENNRYKFDKIFAGLNWVPSLTSPLTLPGVNVKTGEYLLAVNGRELHANENLFSFFEATAGKQTVLRVGPSADGKDARDVTVVPIDDEDDLRYYDWIEGNRKKVGQLSGGKVAYVYMPNTGGPGFNSFNRFFYAQLDKQAVVLDERFNEGGFIADYMIETLRRIPLSGMVGRNGKIQHDPVGAIFGPKVMLINQNSGSGGDAMPWYFQKAGVGKLIGTRTWGGLIGIGGYPSLIDGGFVTAPHFGFFGLNGHWEVENHGIAPDVMVEELPKDVAAGHDEQLETGVKIVLQELNDHPLPALQLPPYPNYHQNDGLGVTK